MKKGKTTVEVRRRPVVDRTGDKTPGVRIGELRRCIVWPRSTSEEADRGRVTIDGLTVWAPAPLDLTPDSSDLIVHKGVEYEIEGAVGDWLDKGIMFEVVRYGG